MAPGLQRSALRKPLATGAFEVPKPAIAETETSQLPGDSSLAAENGLRREEVVRMRLFARILVGLSVFTVPLVILARGDSFARWLASFGLVVIFGGAVWVLRAVRDESHYDLTKMLIFDFSCIAGGYCTLYYFGLFSPVIAIVPVGIYAFSPAQSTRASFAIFVACALLQAALVLAITFGAIADRGLVRSDLLSWQGKLAILFIVEAAFATAYLAARSHRAATQRVLKEREAVQATLVMTDRLASMGALAAGVGHEVNNPLSYVLTNLRLLCEDLAVEGTIDNTERARIRALLRESVSGCERVQRIVKDLNALSREDRDRVARPIDVRKVLDAALNVAASQLRHRARIVRDFAEVPRVMGSDSRLGQVFVNLIVNAAHAMPESRREKNELRIAVRPLPNATLSIEIADNGCGISAEDAKHVFDPFFTTKKVGVGSGLGLTICRSIVTALGGEIALESVQGTGTTVRITLPTTTAGSESVAPASMRPPAKASSPAHVLVIDDEAAVGRSIARALKGHHVEVVSSGAAALERCRTSRFDLILCDLMMPDMTGMEVHEALSATDPELAQRMFFLTGGAFTERAQEFVAKLPSERTLGKPIQIQELRRLAQTAAST